MIVVGQQVLDQELLRVSCRDLVQQERQEREEEPALAHPGHY